ncbi:rho GTPase-activating protein SYDE2 [Corythoichthys intestinalis]|uniref:rho GTPase-activating protein SYDE2 n=1 Tax=Corythoichthys intestinalis TaxID=161448 RepID=UPI0025A5D134|nr:rho GTPase-activating protein SYDE2 [Corythoichthys intestinalis]
MADPLRRTLLAKLRGKKNKKGETLGAGLGSTVAANEGREGKEKVLQMQRDSVEARPVVTLSGLDYTAERMSTYENCVDGPVVQAPGVELLRLGRSEELAGSCPPLLSSGGRVRVNGQLPGVSLQREVQFAGHAITGANTSHWEPACDDTIIISGGVSFGDTHAQRKHFISVPWQCSVGDSIGFGDNSNIFYSYAQTVNCTTSDCEPPAQGQSQRMSRTVAAINIHNANNQSLKTPVLTNPVNKQTEETLIRTIETYDLAYSGDFRGPLQSPAFFPTELEICDISLASMCDTKVSLKRPLDSEDEDYYDNEILPFYETRVKNSSDKGDVAALPQIGQDERHADDMHPAQETDRLRNQLKEAYYLLINAMNDINLDQQASAGLTEHQTTSSCSSQSRDSLCSRLSARNMDSDSWSSGGEHSPQQVSDTDSLLLCIGENIEAGLKLRLKCKSMVNLPLAKIKSTLVRCASDRDIRYPGGPLQCTNVHRTSPVVCDDEIVSELKSNEDSEDADIIRVGELSKTQVAFSDASCGRLSQVTAGRNLVESSGSINSLTDSSDSNLEGFLVPPGHDNKQQPTEVPTQGTNTLSKGNGVTVNKMQQWMHKGRLLSSEMKQRIEGSSSSCGRSQSIERPSPEASLSGPGVQMSSQAVKSVKSPASKTPQHSALIENVQTQEASRAIELSARRPHLHSITVAKKRNWLQQSTLGKNHCNKDELQGMLGPEEEGYLGYPQLPPPSSPSSEQMSSGAPVSHPSHLNVHKVSGLPDHKSVDPAEENDADDEGEIWYNPIPEDDELEVSNRPTVRLLAPCHAEPRRGRDAGQNTRILETSGPESLGESSSVDGSQGNDVLHLHRQVLASKPQEEGGPFTSKSIDVPGLPNIVGFSPPSSPNPTKKSSSINWSFPDKIKSPRTVRKISMKMKKLPELSRKLSVKGQSSSNGNGGGHLEPRSHSLRATSGGSEATSGSSGTQRLVVSGVGLASRNVISRYHLDSSVSTQNSFNKKKNNGSSKSASKGGYLSDGDSPELVAKSAKHSSVEGKGNRCRDVEVPSGSSKLNGTDLDIDAFRHYSFTEQPKCSQYISGLMSLHFYGAEDLKPPRIDSRDVYCAIQVDSVNKARTALLTCRTTFLGMDHTFNIELENAQHLKLVVFSWEPTPKRNRVCCHGTVVLPALFRVIRSHQLAVKLEPRGLIYVKLNLMEQWQNSLDGGPDGNREPQVFGVEAWRVVEREDTGLMVPLLISKCINEIEKRGCQVVGLYRLCGSAAVKKELREAFERDSYAVELCENTYPDINVITGVLKDYLRELPYPLITKQLYDAVLDSMAARPLRMGAAGCENDHADSEHTVSLLENLPEVERMTLRKLLDHLKLVASHQEVNKMTCQNLAVCFGPVLLSQRQEASCHSNRVFIDSEELASALHFKKHIEVLHYLLQLWPVGDSQDPSSWPETSDSFTAPPLRRKKERPQVLNFTEAEMVGVLRPKLGRLDSPSNRYAGDWSGCGDSYFSSDILLVPQSKEEADYDDVPSEDTDEADEGLKKPEEAEVTAREEVTSPSQCLAEQVRTLSVDVAKEEEEQPDGNDDDDGVVMEEAKEEVKDCSSNCEHLEEEQEDKESVCEHILPPRLHREHAYQAYMKIQDISPVLSNRVNLRDLQESIDTLIGNLERELNKNKLNVGY